MLDRRENRGDEVPAWPQASPRLAAGPRLGSRGRRESGDGLGGFRLLVEHEMAGALEHLDLRLRQRLLPKLPMLGRHKPVLVAPHDEGRNVDAVKVALKLWVPGLFP